MNEGTCTLLIDIITSEDEDLNQRIYIPPTTRSVLIHNGTGLVGQFLGEFILLR